MDLLMVISLLGPMKTFMYSFVNNQLIFLKWEEQHRYSHSQINYTISGIVLVTTSQEVWDHFFTKIQMATKFTFTLYTDIYHHQQLRKIRFLIQCSASRLLLLRSCKMIGIPFCVASSSINVLNKSTPFYKGLLFNSVLTLFQNASSNSFVFHILLFLLNMIFRIELKGALSELVWSHVFFAEFICSLVLNSQKQFLWYLMLDNFN